MTNANTNDIAARDAGQVSFYSLAIGERFTVPKRGTAIYTKKTGWSASERGESYIHRFNANDLVLKKHGKTR